MIVDCSKCAINGTTVAKLVCVLCPDKEHSLDEPVGEVRDELSCLSCAFSCEDLYGPHCGVCLASWPFDAERGPMWTPSL